MFRNLYILAHAPSFLTSLNAGHDQLLAPVRGRQLRLPRILQQVFYGHRPESSAPQTPGSSTPCHSYRHPVPNNGAMERQLRTDNVILHGDWISHINVKAGEIIPRSLWDRSQDLTILPRHGDCPSPRLLRNYTLHLNITHVMDRAPGLKPP